MLFCFHFSDNEALDGLLLLAASPMVHLTQPSDSLETPPKVSASSALKSPALASTRSVPVVLSPGNTSPSKRPSQPIVSHVRRLNFKATDIDHTAEVNTPASTPESSNGKVINMEKEVSGGKKHPEGKKSEMISKDQITEVKDITREVCLDHKEQPSTEGMSRIDLEKMTENAGVSKEAVEIGQVEGEENTPVVFRGEKEKSDSSSSTMQCVKDDNIGSEDVAFCSESRDKTDTENCSRNEETRSFKDSPLKLQVLEEVATNELLECQNKTVQPAETTKTPAESSPTQPVSKKSSVIDVDAERSVDVLPCGPIKTEVSGGLALSIKAEVSCVTKCTDVKTAESTKGSGNDLTSSADLEKVFF